MLVYLGLILLCLILAPVLYIDSLRTPFAGAFIEHTLMLNTSQPTEAGSWELNRQVEARFGYQLIAIDQDGTPREFDWATASDDAWWLDDGQLEIGGEVFPVFRLEVQAPALLGQVQVRITDVAPTAAAALGLSVPDRR